MPHPGWCYEENNCCPTQNININTGVTGATSDGGGMGGTATGVTGGLGT